jgi:hypothetical protein
LVPGIDGGSEVDWDELPLLSFTVTFCNVQAFAISAATPVPDAKTPMTAFATDLRKDASASGGVVPENWRKPMFLATFPALATQFKISFAVAANGMWGILGATSRYSKP